MKNTMTLSRRGLLKSGGAMIVSFAFSGTAERLLAQAPGAAPPPMDLDNFLTVHPDGKVTLRTSRVDPGTGIRTVYAQITAEEMGLPVDRITVIDGDTAIVPNHGGTGGSQGVPRGGADIRRAAATARKALLDLGAKRLGKPAGELTIVGGNVQPVSGGAGVSIAELIGGKRFELKLDPDAPVRNPSSYAVVGKPVRRPDVPGKATGTFVFVHDHKLPGMLHGRVIRPTVIGAKLVSVDEASISAIPDVKVVRIENFLGVVAKDEWAAIRASGELKVTWGEGKAFPTTSVSLASAMRETKPEQEQQALNKGDVTAGLGTAAKKLSASYYWPFHSHASMGPSCSVADVKDSGVTVWSSTQDVFGVRGAVARALSVPPARVRVVYLDGSGSYGSNGAYDAAHDAALLSRAVGQPV
ncbi:MAG TPA: molybdopterin cofactor-binding domain-containing protein, partial [Bryobacteraceae bacterium]|nr:molybdopterin cofactor-binding domain-containing protein [Bryobacteraceae bacterium]